MFIIAIANDLCCLLDQLTRFQGDGGFAVGVSCSLMLSDPLSLGEVPRVVGAHARPDEGSERRRHPPAHAVRELLPAPGPCARSPSPPMHLTLSKIS